MRVLKFSKDIRYGFLTYHHTKYVDFKVCLVYYKLANDNHHLSNHQKSHYSQLKYNHHNYNQSYS